MGVRLRNRGGFNEGRGLVPVHPQQQLQHEGRVDAAKGGEVVPQLTHLHARPPRLLIERRPFGMLAIVVEPAAAFVVAPPRCKQSVEPFADFAPQLWEKGSEGSCSSGASEVEIGCFDVGCEEGELHRSYFALDSSTHAIAAS